MAGKKRIDELKLTSEQQERLIELLHEEPDLWNTSSTSYSKKDCRRKALRNIVEQLKERYEGLECNVNQIQAKISYLRGYYSKELSKMNKSRKSGAGTDELYTSSWIHFKSLDAFLKTHIVPRGSSSNLDANNLGDDDDEIEGDSADNMSETSQEDSRPGPMRKKPRLSGPESVMSQAMTCLQDIRRRTELKSSSPTPIVDEDGHYGNYIAGALRKLDGRVKALVKLKFQTILFEAEYGSMQNQGTMGYSGALHMPSSSLPVQTMSLPHHGNNSQPMGQQYLDL